MRFSWNYLKRWLSANRRQRPDKSVIIPLFIVLLWFMGNVISPYLAPAGTVYFGDEGMVGYSDNAEEISRIENGFARFFYNAGDRNCHQHEERSFFLNDNQMPFCARCTAIFFGMVVGVLILMFFALELNVFWIIMGLVPIGLDGGIQLLTDYESTNLIRFITGSLAGIVTGIALGFIASEIGQIVVRKRHQDRS